MKNYTFVILSFLMLVVGCNINIGSKVAADLYENNVKIDAYFCPREDCSGIIKNAISNAENSVHCAFYEIELKEIINVIAEKSHTADVKVVIDKGNYHSQIKGPRVKTIKSTQYMHNKFCIIDNNLVLTGSTNPTENGVNFNNNNVVIIKSRYLAENYNEEFDELWGGISTAGDKVKHNKINSDSLVIENYFCPEDNCRDKIIEAVNKAEKSIYFMVFSFTDEDIADSILFKNVDTRGIFETRGSGTDYSQYNRLKGFGIDVKKDKNPKTMHHKVFIIDNNTVITGSMNPTGSGNYRNDENILIIENKGIADRFLEEFMLLWD